MKNNNKTTITISFKKEELHYLQKFKEMYAVPTAILKDFIIATVKNNGVQEVSSNNKDTSQTPPPTTNDIDLFDF